MQFLRKAALTVAASLLTITLFSFGPAWSAYQTVHNSGGVKDALKTSGIYSAAIPELLDQQQKDHPAGQQTAGGNTNEIPLDRPEVRQVIERAFPPSFLQAQTEQVVDSVYNWLDGDTPQLQFTINLSQAKTSLVDGLVQYALDRLNSLPECTGAAAIPTENIDAFNATCVPAGVDKNAIAGKVREQFSDSEFLKDTTITADTLKNDNGEPVTKQASHAPDAYQFAGLAMAGGLLTAVALGAAVVFLGATRRSGLRKVAIIALTTGIVGGGLAVLSNIAVHKFVHKALAAGNADVPLRPQLVSIMQSLADDMRSWWVIYAAILIVLAVGVLITLHVTAPKDVIDLTGPPVKHPKKGSEAAKDLPSTNGTIVRHEHTLQPLAHAEPENPGKPPRE